MDEKESLELTGNWGRRDFVSVGIDSLLRELGRGGVWSPVTSHQGVSEVFSCTVSENERLSGSLSIKTGVTVFLSFNA